MFEGWGREKYDDMIVSLNNQLPSMDASMDFSVTARSSSTNSPGGGVSILESPFYLSCFTKLSVLKRLVSIKLIILRNWSLLFKYAKMVSQEFSPHSKLNRQKPTGRIIININCMP